MSATVDAILAGDRLALARLLTQVENDSPAGRTALDELFLHTGKAHLVGVTGAPGTGKSSLVNQVTLAFRRAVSPKRVAILAVDPSSPFTGGALLGDRVRMRDLTGDPGVFIRSMATRGSLGGLAQTTAAMVQVLDSAGFEIICIETVGAGQTEVDIARLAHTTLVVEAPGLGDEIQAIKAGILEIADILVVNKADLPGVENTERALRGMLGLAHPVEKVFRHHKQNGSQSEPAGVNTGIWVPPILRTVATDGQGVTELVKEVEMHALHLHQSGEWEHRERTRLEADLMTRLTAALVSQVQRRIPPDRFTELVDQLATREISPWQAVRSLLGQD